MVAGEDRGDGSDSEGGGNGEGDGDSDGAWNGDGPVCPECGGPLPGGAVYCPQCKTALDGPATDRAELDGLFDDRAGQVPVHGAVDAGGRQRAPRSVRLLAGLAVSLPVAPLAFFLVAAVVDLTAWTALTVFLVGWLGPAAYLVRAPFPAEAFGRSLYLVAAGTALVPVALRVGPASDTAGLGLGLGTITAVCLAVAGTCLALGTFVTSQARPGPEGDARVLEGRGE